MRCGRCGSENSDTNRFCGMCGAPLAAKPAATAAPRPVAAPVGASEARAMPPLADARPSLRPSSDPTRLMTPPRDTAPLRKEPMEDPVISGPSFLGLNKPAASRVPEQLEDDPHPLASFDSRERYSSNLDYLLQDEEQPKRGWGKLFAIVIALALVGGFGYLRWKQGGFDWLLKAQKTGQTVEATPDTANTGKNDAGATAGTAATGTNDAQGTAPSTTTTTPNAATTGTVAPNATTPAEAAGTTPTPTSAPAASGTDSSVPPDTAAPPVAPESTASSNTSAAASGGNTPPAASGTNATTANAAPGVANTETAPAAKPSPIAKKTREARPTPATPVDPTAEAESYIYGRGVPQDCDRGLRLLKPVAAHNVKAMIALGSLYSSGTCTPRDLPTAYRYYAMALHQQPDNQPVQNYLQDIWAKMTQPERQLAIKLSQ